MFLSIPLALALQFCSILIIFFCYFYMRVFYAFITSNEAYFNLVLWNLFDVIGSTTFLYVLVLLVIHKGWSEEIRTAYLSCWSVIHTCKAIAIDVHNFLMFFGENGNVWKCKVDDMLSMWIVSVCKFIEWI